MDPPDEAPPPADDPRPWLRLHGLPALSVAGPWMPLERKDAAWLAVLALDGATPRDTLAAWLWPGVPQKTANTSLRQRVFRLRRRAGHPLLSAGATLALEPAVQRLPAAGAEWLAAFAYDDCPEFARWLQRQRELAAAARLERLDAECTELEAAGELAAALERAQALQAAEPLSEHALRRVMQLHAARGDRAAAVAAFERFEQRLKDELGTRPAPPTLALLQQVESAGPAAMVRASRRSLPAALQRPPRLVGRDAELADLAAAWAAQRVFLVLGEAGMGKSRLLDELARRRGTALRVAARPGDAAVPFALLARLLRQLRERSREPAPEPLARELARVMPEIGPAAAGEAQRLVLQRAVQWQLEAAPVRELLLDDLHFADAASLEMLQGLLAGEPPAGLLFGLAQRPGEGGPAAAALQQALEETQRLQPVPLHALDAAALAQLVESLGLPELNAAALAPQLLRHSGGNPLFALETLKDLWLADAVPGAGPLPQPATVGVLIERRLRTLTPPAMALARVAALAGLDFDIALAEAVLDTPALALADAWGELEAAQVLAGGAFAHDLVFDAVQRTVPAAIAGHVHGRIADVLQARGAAPATLAPHLALAGRHAAAGQAWRAAALVARKAGRRGDQLLMLREAERAWRLADEPDDAWAARVAQIEPLGVTESQAAALSFAEALLADPALPGAHRAAAQHARAGMLQFAGRMAESAEAAALALQDPEATESTRIGAVVVRANALAMLGRADEALALGDAWQARVLALDDDGQRAYFLGGRIGPLVYAHRRREALHLAREHVALARRIGVISELCVALANVSAVAVPLGDLGVVLQHGREALALTADEAPGSFRLSMLQSQLAWPLQAAGAYGESLALLEQAVPGLQAAAPGSAVLANAESYLSDLWLALGQRAKALAAVQGEHAAVPGWVRARRLLARARAQPGGSASEQGVQTLRAALPLCEGSVGEPVALAIRLDLTATLAADDAADVCEAVRQRALAAELVVLATRAALCRLLALHRAGRAGAADALALSRASAGVAGPGLYAPELALAVAQVLAACGEPSLARAAASEGLAWIDTVALPQVPAPLRESFLHRNPVNVALRALAAVTRQ